jgi:hypothetical protein
MAWHGMAWYGDAVQRLCGNLQVDISKARSLLGWVPPVSVEEGQLHTLVPGLTGWAQVNGRDELPIPEKVKLDVAYLQRQSLWFDIRILWLTFVKVLNRDGVSH